MRIGYEAESGGEEAAREPQLLLGRGELEGGKVGTLPISPSLRGRCSLDDLYLDVWRDTSPWTQRNMSTRSAPCSHMLSRFHGRRVGLHLEANTCCGLVRQCKLLGSGVRNVKPAVLSPTSQLEAYQTTSPRAREYVPVLDGPSTHDFNVQTRPKLSIAANLASYLHLLSPAVHGCGSYLYPAAILTQLARVPAHEARSVREERSKMRPESHLAGPSRRPIRHEPQRGAPRDI
ncbi:hypothetical protein C8Q80DRAFT_486710 [Daedaleopsis nitida]|nr:hypothetical protein C8Q80DRAFT_486710 [Daedaleopsis nitida]